MSVVSCGLVSPVGESDSCTIDNGSPLAVQSVISKRRLSSINTKQQSKDLKEVNDGSIIYLVPQPMHLEAREDTLTCPIVGCDMKLTKRHSLAVHIKRHIGPNPLDGITTICSVASTILNANDGTHSEEANGGDTNECKMEYVIRFQCPEEGCQYSKTGGDWFKKLKYLKQHYLKTHTSKTYKCSKENCDKWFSTLPYLIAHQRSCGISFCCSCSKEYSSLNTLQTHARRKGHSYDVELYKNLISDAKKLEKTPNAKKYDLNEERQPCIEEPGKFEESELPQKANSNPREVVTQSETISTSINSVGISYEETIEQTDIGSSFFVRLVPNLLPKTNTVQYFLLDNLRPIKMEKVPSKIDIGTQTSASQRRRAISGSAEPSVGGGRTSQRKNSAATQTGKYRARVSTETQTLTKRKRCTKRKQSAETQTFPNSRQSSTSFAVTQQPIADSEEHMDVKACASSKTDREILPDAPSVVSPMESVVDVTLPSILQRISTSSSFEEYSTQEAESQTSLLNPQIQNGNATSPMPWSFNDDAFDLFGGELSGIHIETQTDNDNWSPPELPSSLLTDTFCWTDSDINDRPSLSLVTTETQTKDIGLVSAEDDFHLLFGKEEGPSVGEAAVNSEFVRIPSNQGITFLTMDSETQTLSNYL